MRRTGSERDGLGARRPLAPRGEAEKNDGDGETER
jgi:hypothetical protein